MIRRRRFEPAISLKHQLALYAKAARDLASHLQLGPEKDELLARAAWADASATHLRWAPLRSSRPARVEPRRGEGAAAARAVALKGQRKLRQR
jgi:hypothetical protein